MQRNFLRIAEACAKRGHEIHVYTMEWQGREPPHFAIDIVPAKGIANHNRYRRFADYVSREARQQRFAAISGFNKIPRLDVYYAADPCFQCSTGRAWIARLGGRYRTLAEFERSVFDPSSRTQILLLSDAQKDDFIRCYGTQQERFHLMPPVLPQTPFFDRATARAEVGAEFGVAPDDKLIVLIGSGFRTKGLDRALTALAALPQRLRERTQFMVIGEDNVSAFSRLAKKLGVRFLMLGGRDDAQRFLAAADLLIHPAYREAAGAVLLEAMAAGTPVLTTDVCGYAHHVARARAGEVLRSPFQQEALNESLEKMLSEEKSHWGENGIRYVASLDVPSRAEMAADVIEVAAAKSIS